MKTLFIFLVMSKPGAVVFIITLLLVAALIGYLTAWYYAKSVYLPIIKGLENEKDDLIKKVAGLKEEIEKLNGKADKLNEKINSLERELEEKEKEMKHLKKKNKE
jgi:peptidoglycan hydrolase CwlO-like protein